VIIFDPAIRERYAQAVFNVARRQGINVELMAEVDEILKLFEANSKIRRFLEGPQITTETKQKVLDSVFKGRATPLFHQLFSLLLAKDRVSYIQPILMRFKVLVERDQGIFEADVETATSLDESQKRALQSALERFTKAKLKINFGVNLSLISGVRFSYGDVLIDDTVKGKLYKLRQQLEQAARQ
jgi:F-type H+-transporting ATPase subunit delta